MSVHYASVEDLIVPLLGQSIPLKKVGNVYLQYPVSASASDVWSGHKKDCLTLAASTVLFTLIWQGYLKPNLVVVVNKPVCLALTHYLAGLSGL